MTRASSDWSSPPRILFLLAALLAAVFLVDLAVPLGVAAGVPYVIAVLVSLRAHNRRLTLVVAAAGTVLTLTGYLLSPQAGIAWMVVANRGIAVGVIWLTAFLSLELSRIAAALRETTYRIQTILDTAPDGIIVIDQFGVIESYNCGAEKLFGHPAARMIGRNVSTLMPSPHAEAHDGYLKRYRSTREAHIIGVGREVIAKRSDGTLFPVRLAISELTVHDRLLFTGIIHDITELREAKQEALEDPLTGLPNRRAFDNVVSAALSRGPASLLMIDIDHFKRVNDELGHAAGDSALVAVAEQLGGSLRAQDRGMCARLGGDEFAVLLPDTPVEAAERIAARIMNRTVPVLAGIHASCAISIGVAALAQGGAPERLLTLADEAMYRAKQTRGQVSR